MKTDLTFITNENGQSLKDRFDVLIKDARFFFRLQGSSLVAHNWKSTGFSLKLTDLLTEVLTNQNLGNR